MRGERARLFVAVGVLALLWRLVHLAALRDLEFFGVLGLDAEFYDRWARALAQGTPWPREVYFQGPLFPHLLSLLYRLTGPQLLAAQILQMLMGSASAGFAALIAHELFGRRAAWIAGVLAAGYGFAIFLETHLVAAPLLCLLLSAALWIHLRSSGRPWQMLAVGLLLGLAATVRGNVLLAAAIGTLALVLTRRPRQALWLAAGVVVVIAPVAVRNLRVGGELALISANGGINYYIGNHEGASGLYEQVQGVEFFQSGMPHDGGSIAEAERRSGRSPLSAVEASDWWFAEALRWQRSHPWSAAKLMLRKFGFLAIDYEIPQIENFEWARNASALLRATPFRYGPLVALALVGMVFAWMRGGRPRELVVLVLAYWISVAVFFVTARFRMVIVPALAALAAFAVLEIVEALRNRAWRRGGGAAVAFLTLCVLSLGATPQSHRESSQQSIAYSRGVIAMQEGDFARAAREFQGAAAQNPDDVAAWTNLGFCQEQLGRTELALQAYQAAMALEPANPRILEPYSTSLLRAGRFDEARQRLEQLVALDPANWYGWASLGDLALQQGEGEKGLEYWRRVLEGDSDPQLKAMARERLR